MGVLLQSGVDPADVRVALDGVDVTAAFAPGGVGLEGILPLPAPGTHELSVDQPRTNLLGNLTTLRAFQRFEVPAAAPALSSFAPLPVQGAVQSGFSVAAQGRAVAFGSPPERR